MACGSAVDETGDSTPGASVGAASQPIPRAPHSLLLVTLDTTRADRLQPYDSRYATPALQRLADDGIVMQQAVAVSPLTLPTHASLLTGLYPPQHGVRSNGRHRLGDGVQTLAEYFAERGDRTAAFLSAAVLERRYGLHQGFELYDDSLEGGKADEARMISERRADVTVDRALAWLDTVPEGQHFFLWVHLFDPHASYDPPSPHREAFAEEPYQGEIHFMDAQIGRLLEHRRLADAKATAVSVIADHGESLGQHGEATHGLLAYDATLHIPWILRLPGGPRGLQWPEPVSQVDLLPTLLDAQGMEFDRDGIAGVSLLPFAPQEAPRTLYAESLDPLFLYGWQPLEVARQGPWKYIDAPTPELYHLLDDPEETDNVYAGQRGTARDLALHLASFREEAPAEAEDPLPLDAETRAKLESLGYTATTATSPAQHGERPDRLDPKDVIDLHHTMQQAEGLMAQGRRQTALDVLGNILERDPRNHQALLHVSRLHFESGDLDAAIRVLEEGLQHYPDETSMGLSLAAMEHQRGRYDRAAVLARQALSTDPNQMEPWLRTARYMLDAGQEDDLTQLYEDAFERFPDDPALHGQFGKILAEASNPQAEVALRRALALAPMADLHLALGDLLESQGRTEDAAEQRRLAAAGQPKPSTDANAHAETLARQGQLQEAEAIWRQLIQDEPEAAPPYGNLATLALQRQDWNQARQLAQRAVELDAGLAPSWNVLAYALEELGRPADAIQAYQQALEADPQYTTARFNMGLLFKKQQDFPRAAQVFETLLRTEPDHWNAHFELILLYAGPLGDPARARPHLLRNLEAQPDHPKAPLLRELLGRIDGALGGS